MNVTERWRIDCSLPDEAWDGTPHVDNIVSVIGFFVKVVDAAPAYNDLGSGLRLWVEGGGKDVDRALWHLRERVTGLSEVKYLGRQVGPWRHFLMDERVRSWSVGWGPLGWSVTFGRHCWTTEADERWS